MYLGYYFIMEGKVYIFAPNNLIRNKIYHKRKHNAEYGNVIDGVMFEGLSTYKVTEIRLNIACQHPDASFCHLHNANMTHCIEINDSNQMLRSA